MQNVILTTVSCLALLATSEVNAQNESANPNYVDTTSYANPYSPYGPYRREGVARPGGPPSPMEQKWEVSPTIKSPEFEY